jgi:hypothetical protein
MVDRDIHEEETLPNYESRTRCNRFSFTFSKAVVYGVVMYMLFLGN